MQKAVTPLSETDRQMIMPLGRHFRELWFSDDCSMALKKQIIRILIREIMVSLDDDTQDLTCMIRWQGGCHTTDKAHLDPHILRLGQAVKYTGGSDTTLMKLITKDILPCHQVAPYAPLEINQSDLDSDPVRSILEHLKATRVLALEGVSLPRQGSLFQSFHSLNKEGYYEDIITLRLPPNLCKNVTDPGWTFYRSAPRLTA